MPTHCFNACPIQVIIIPTWSTHGRKKEGWPEWPSRRLRKAVSVSFIDSYSFVSCLKRWEIWESLLLLLRCNGTPPERERHVKVDEDREAVKSEVAGSSNVTLLPLYVWGVQVKVFLPTFICTINGAINFFYFLFYNFIKKINDKINIWSSSIVDSKELSVLNISVDSWILKDTETKPS